MPRVLPLIATLIALQSAASPIYVTSSRLFRGDLEQRQYTPIGNPGLGSIPELASDPRPQTFRLWTLTFSGAGNTLHQLDPTTAQVTSSTPVVFPTNPVLRTLAFDPGTGALFATGGDPSHPLYRIDPATGVAQLVGNVGNNLDPFGLAFDPAGNLWATATSLAPANNVLARINPHNAAVISTVALTPSSAVPTDLAFRPEDGQLFAISSAAGGILTTIDPATGAQTTIPMTAGEPSMGGLAFGPIPEPAPAALLITAALTLPTRRRRNHAATPPHPSQRSHRRPAKQ